MLERERERERERETFENCKLVSDRYTHSYGDFFAAKLSKVTRQTFIHTHKQTFIHIKKERKKEIEKKEKRRQSNVT